MKKIISLITVVALVAGIAIFGINSAQATAPTGTLTGTVITVNVGELKAINAITVTDSTIPEITDTNNIRIRIPDGVNAHWDVSDTTATLAGTAAGKASAIVSYLDSRTLLIDVLTNFVGSETLIIGGLSYIGHTSTSVAAPLTWATNGGVGTNYGTGDANTSITIANDAQDALTSVSAVPSNFIASATGVNYTVNFTVPAGGVIPANGRIVITFPTGFIVTSAGAGTLTDINGTVIATVSGQDVVLTRSDGATNSLAGTKSVVITGITNHAIATTYTVTVTTRTSAGNLLATALSSTFSVNPAAIANLTCESSGQAGAVWLRWTTPAGTPASYEVRYQQGNSITYDSATVFAQSWALPGAVGTIQQQLLTGLNPNTQYTFAMRAIGGNSTISAVSSPNPTCFAPASARPNPDAVPPTSHITSPVANSNVLAGQPLTVRGTAIDAGGSSVQRVEISFDGGVTWNLSRIVDNVQGNLVWEFTWQNPVVGARTIRTRAYDWAGNIETAGDGIAVNVVTTLPAVAETPVVAVPDLTLPHPVPTTVVQMQENLAVLQTKLISLLQQLLTVLTAQLQASR